MNQSRFDTHKSLFHTIMKLILHKLLVFILRKANERVLIFASHPTAIERIVGILSEERKIQKLQSKHSLTSNFRQNLLRKKFNGFAYLWNKVAFLSSLKRSD